MKTRLQAALAGAAADYCEIRFEESHILSIAFQGRELDRLQKDLAYGVSVRALHRGGWGFASGNDPEHLARLVEQACKQAALAGERQGGRSQLAPVPVVDDVFVPHWVLNPSAVSVSEKVRILTGYHQLMLNSHSAITAASISYGEKCSQLHFANSEGTSISQEKVDIGAGFVATARRGPLTVSRQVGRGSSIGFDALLGVDAELLEQCQLTVQLLDAPPIKAGVYPVICDPALAGLFVHEAFGHLSEADNVYKSPALAQTMQLGRRLGRDLLTIYDTGEYFTHRGALRYDDEGVESKRTTLIHDGLLVGRLHSRETAGLMGEEVTGNARALDYTFPPICRMRSTCIVPGESSLEEMFKDIPLGVYALGSGGGQTNGEMFNFNAGYAYMIRGGQLAELVRDVRLMGNVFTTLANIDRVGDQLDSRSGAGGCGKGAQSPLPTSGLCPAIRIQNVIIGGAK